MEHLVLAPRTLAFFIDDSGDERLGDPGNPLFAFGGVAVMTENYFRVAKPWKAMKRQIFPQIKGPLHFAKLRHMGERREAAVNRCFDSCFLGRFAAVVTDETNVSPELVPNATLGTLANRIADIAKHWPFDNMISVFEHSTRLSDMLQNFFGNMVIHVDGRDPVPFEGCFMPKDACEPFLEMADRVTHVVCNQIRWRRQGNRTPTEGFRSLFLNADDRLRSYLEAIDVVSQASTDR